MLAGRWAAVDRRAAGWRLNAVPNLFATRWRRPSFVWSKWQGHKLMEAEAKILDKHGHEVGGQSTEAGQTNEGSIGVRAAS